MTGILGLLNENQLSKKLACGNHAIAKYRKQKLIKPFGTALNKSGISYFYKPSQVQELRGKLGITLKSTKGLFNERQFVKEFGVGSIKSYRVKGLIKPVGAGLVRGGKGIGGRFYYKPSQIAELKKN